MPIDRTGACPIFLKYIIEQALIPYFAEPENEFLKLTQYNFRWIDIPMYQRGIVWDDELFEELLQSHSVFLGNAIFGSFEVDRANCGYLPPHIKKYEVLIDGLQRFSIGTALLTLLHPLVLSNNSILAGESMRFSALKAQCSNLAPIYQHNDQELRNHRRQAVKESYSEFRRALGRWLQKEFEDGGGEGLAKNVQRLFLERQIAPDTYFGFGSVYEVSNTFIGLNTVREELSTVDWLRSAIVERGAISSWEFSIIESLENRFTEVFSKDRELNPFVGIILECIVSSDSPCPEKVFPSWESLLDSEVMQFLDFVSDIINKSNNQYFNEIRKCGTLPLAGCLCYYYKNYLKTAQFPSFISGGNNEDPELLKFLRANYRVLLDGRIGRTREYAKHLLVHNITLDEISDSLSKFFIGRNINDKTDEHWLNSRLKDTQKGRAPRVFNACLLPEHGTTLLTFQPHIYGAKATQYQIDHMIPESGLQINAPGDSEGHLMMNFAPVRKTANNRQSNISCSAKICPQGSFDAECNNDPNVHPYISWLVQNQSKHGSLLDRQDLLQSVSNPPIGQERIDWLADRLIDRL